MIFTLRAKLVATLLCASLLSASAVGGIAYWLLMQDFNAALRETAFGHFQSDMQAYIGEYGSWENAQRRESFHAFVMRHRDGYGRWREKPDSKAPPAPPENRSAASPHRGPPFRFLVADPRGRLLLAFGNYRQGQYVGDEMLHQARPIRVNGQVAVLAIPNGEPRLSAEDRTYLGVMRKALLQGLLAAGVLAVALGFLLGSRFGARVRELTAAIQSMRSDGELRQQVPVRSRDEMGELATAFNRMSSELAHAHAELKMTAEQVQIQSGLLRELSIRDPLTHLFNRRHFDEHAAQLYRQSMRHGRSLCVMVGDLDHFKFINDNFSHAVGDEVLRRVAELMQRNTRSSDVVARYGGEEFVIAFVESTAEQAAIRCEVLRSTIEEHLWHKVHPQLRVTMSMGLSDDTSLGNVEKMLAAADARLYEAKRQGRNRVVAC